MLIKRTMIGLSFKHLESWLPFTGEFRRWSDGLNNRNQTPEQVQPDSSTSLKQCDPRSFSGGTLPTLLLTLGLKEPGSFCIDGFGGKAWKRVLRFLWWFAQCTSRERILANVPKGWQGTLFLFQVAPDSSICKLYHWLPESEGNTVILVMINRFSKAC